eukprot:UN29307
MPLSGEVLEVNESLAENSGLVNTSPLDGGWFVKIKLTGDASEQDDLLTLDQYTKTLEQ